MDRRTARNLSTAKTMLSERRVGKKANAKIFIKFYETVGHNLGPVN